MWVADGAGSVSHIDGAARRETRRFVISRGPYTLACDADGVWIGQLGGLKSRITPLARDAVEEISIPTAVHGVAIANDHVWVTSAPAGVVCQVRPRDGDSGESDPVPKRGRI